MRIYYFSFHFQKCPFRHTLYVVNRFGIQNSIQTRLANYKDKISFFELLVGLDIQTSVLEIFEKHFANPIQSRKYLLFI